ncbi:Aste57867_18348 [Aphanomyces stellatus]|uniref:Aste57867_18348 protein n=1 Tax=Aphanomyces stellatus TaxID=120398 RepID=A0A485LA45_9STRA|nr:hypothetical protein As57867_018286 [Aphanomyces stellatus]VFT95084.1 Aste57867_18348 [Aphanomyces stellatus]
MFKRWKRASLHGDVLVHCHFEVPKDDTQWPWELWDLKLGSWVRNLRKTQSTMPTENKAALDAMGFIWDALAYQWETNGMALETYKSLFGHLRVPYQYIVRDQDPAWPSSTWNMNLGNLVSTLRKSKETMTPEKHELLEAMGFVWKVNEYRGESSPPPKIPLDHQQMILEMAHYIHTNLQGHDKFMNFPKSKVPDQDPWPEHWRGITLDISTFRSAYEQGLFDPLIVPEFDKIGFVWNCFGN